MFTPNAYSSRNIQFKHVHTTSAFQMKGVKIRIFSWKYVHTDSQL